VFVKSTDDRQSLGAFKLVIDALSHSLSLEQLFISQNSELLELWSRILQISPQVDLP
jgi:hypothetical protein